MGKGGKSVGHKVSITVQKQYLERCRKAWDTCGVTMSDFINSNIRQFYHYLKDCGITDLDDFDSVERCYHQFMRGERPLARKESAAPVSHLGSDAQ